MLLFIAVFIVVKLRKLFNKINKIKERNQTYPIIKECVVSEDMIDNVNDSAMECNANPSQVEVISKRRNSSLNINKLTNAREKILVNLDMHLQQLYPTTGVNKSHVVNVIKDLPEENKDKFVELNEFNERIRLDTEDIINRFGDDITQFISATKSSDPVTFNPDWGWGDDPMPLYSRSTHKVRETSSFGLTNYNCNSHDNGEMYGDKPILKQLERILPASLAYYHLN